jgi:hypothetical protein
VSNWFDYPSTPTALSAPSPWPETGDGSEAYPVLPICITIDTSGSMAASGALEAMNACLPKLRTFLRNEPTAGEMARIGLVTFNTSAREVLPLCDVDQVAMPTLTAEDGQFQRSVHGPGHDGRCLLTTPTVGVLQDARLAVVVA